jgi:pheganomycin biosynthesis PGM1-like protein
MEFGKQSIVVLPSRSVERWHEPPAETQAYEERLLCLLLMLRDPRLSMVYLTSSPVAPAIAEYYLSLLAPAVRGSARARLTLLSPGDRSPGPLSGKLLARPHLLAQIRRAAPQPAVLLPYMTTELERDLALALGMPLYGADPCLQGFGTKSGSRRLFAQAGVPHPLGVANVSGGRGAIDAIVRLRAAKPELVEVLVKLDDGVSGEGNAVVDLRELPRPGAGDERPRVAERLERMVLEASGVSVDAYLDGLATRGGVVEERLMGPDLRSPSVQLSITPAGDVEIVSTHDQVLEGQRYVGCRFPAERPYAEPIARLALDVGRQLAAAGVIGRSAVDFVVVRDSDHRWRPYAVEINLRSGGTTHPLATLALLTGGAYDARAATFTTPAGTTKHYVATDHLADPSLRELGRDGLLALLRSGRLGFDHVRQRGVVFHMLSSLDELGVVGLTAVGDTPADARRCYDRAASTVLESPQRWTRIPSAASIAALV